MSKPKSFIGTTPVPHLVYFQSAATRRVIARTTRVGRPRVKAESPEIELIDVDINDADRIVVCDVVIELLVEQGALCPVFAFNEFRHPQTPLQSLHLLQQPSRHVFTLPRH